MRKYGILVIALVVAILIPLSGCKEDPAKKADAALVEIMKEVKVPAQVNNATTLTACYYADKVLTYRNETNADTLAALNIDSLKQATLHNLKNNLFSKKLISQVVTAGASIRYIYVNGEDSVMFTLTNEELSK